MKYRWAAFVAVAILAVATVVPTTGAQALEERVLALEQEVDALAPGGLVIFLYGVFCALWAQNSGRSSWLWFFAGLFFAPITAVVLLVKNSGDRKRRVAGTADPTSASAP